MLPSLVYLALTVLGIGLAGAKHGEPQKPYNIWSTLFATAVALAILYWGGFFAPLLGAL